MLSPTRKLRGSRSGACFLSLAPELDCAQLVRNSPSPPGGGLATF